MSISNIIEAFTRKLSKISIVSHVNADIDSFSSAYVLKEIIKKYYERKVVYLVFPNGISYRTRVFLNKSNIPLPFYYSDKIPSSDGIILVDVQSPVQVGSLSDEVLKYRKRILVIDHHKADRGFEEFLWGKIILNEPAACIIIYRISEELGIELSRISRYLVLAGAIADSRRFKISSANLFRIAYEIISRGGIDYQKVLNALHVDKVLSEKIAMIKAYQRCKFYKVADLLIVATYVSTSQADVANMLINSGADLAIVFSREKNEKTRIILRSSEKFYEATGLDMGGKLIPMLLRVFKGKGGGHTYAGGLIIPTEIENIEHLLLRFILTNLSTLLYG